nr:hypothetical protein [Desulfurococcales archaeon]
MRASELARILSDVVPEIPSPILGLEQYTTPPELAVEIAFHAKMSGLLEGGVTVLDVGAGTCMLSLPMLLLDDSALVVAVEADPRLGGLCLEASRVLGVHERIVYAVQRVSDAIMPPLSSEPHLAVTNPPFGVWRRGADWGLLRYAMRSGARRVYAILKSGNLDLHSRRASSMGYECRM